MEHGVLCGLNGGDCHQRGTYLETAGWLRFDGQASGVLSGRVSYALGLRGPRR